MDAIGYANNGSNSIDMRVAFYIHDMSGGGAEHVFLNWINYLAENSYPVLLILNERQGKYLSLLDERVEIQSVNSKSIPKVIGFLRKLFQKEKPDVIISTLSMCNFIAITAKLLSFRSPKVIIREANSFITQRARWPFLRRSVDRISGVILYRFANLILVNSQGSKSELSQALFLSRNKISIIKNPIYLDHIRAKSTEEIPQFIADFLNGSNYFVAAGRLVWAKGFDILIKAFSKIESNDLKLVILGDGDKRQELTAQIVEEGVSDKILLAGNVDNPYSIIKSSCLFVLSSRYEGMPNVLIEALALQVPIVATDCPSGPRELLRDGRFGQLVSIDDVDSLSLAIKNPDPVAHTEEREKAVLEFDISQTGKQLMKLISNNQL